MSRWTSILLAKVRASRFSFVLWVFFLLVVGAVSFYDYPGFHFWADGGWRGWLMVCAVDAVMGPLLFFVVFWPGKARHLMIFDITILVTIQFSVMVWGLHSVLKEHPVADCYTLNGFQSLTAEPYRLSGLDLKRLGQLSVERPPIVYVRLPTRQELPDLIAHINRGIPAAAQWKYLEPLTAADCILNRERYQKAVQGWLLGDGSDIWHQWLGHHADTTPAQWRFGFFAGRYRSVLLIFDRSDQFAGYVMLPGDLPHL